MSRKTLDVKSLKTQVNSMLADSTCSPKVRNGMILVLETALHETGNYCGFLYLVKRDVPEGQKPGVQENADGTIPPYESRFKDTDDTRRQYL